MVRINASRFANHDAFLKICDAKKDTKTTKIAASFFYQLTAVLRYFLSEISSQKSHQIENWKLCCAYSSRMLCVFFANFVRILRICCVYSSCLLHIFFAYVIVTCILRVCCAYSSRMLSIFFAYAVCIPSSPSPDFSTEYFCDPLLKC